MNAHAADPVIPFLDQALDIERAQPILARHLGEIDLRAARLTRHKPGRRCLIEYDMVTPDGLITRIGKIRAKGLDLRSHATLVACRDAGLPVPEPLGQIPEFRMVLQRKVPGVPLTQLLAGPHGVSLARAATDVAFRLHEAGVPTDRRHTLADELRILHERLSLVAQQHPCWTERLSQLLVACQRLAWSIRAPFTGPCGIHRDFYADQILVDGDRLVLLDLDLYCEGNPALDIGNFAAHIIEQSLREHGTAAVLSDREQALVDRYLSLVGEEHRAAVDVFTTLSLVRHIWISTRIPERRYVSERLIDLCEQRAGSSAAMIPRSVRVPTRERE